MFFFIFTIYVNKNTLCTACLNCIWLLTGTRNSYLWFVLMGLILKQIAIWLKNVFTCFTCNCCCFFLQIISYFRVLLIYVNKKYIVHSMLKLYLITYANTLFLFVVCSLSLKDNSFVRYLFFSCIILLNNCTAFWNKMNKN